MTLINNNEVILNLMKKCFGFRCLQVLSERIPRVIYASYNTIITALDQTELTSQTDVYLLFKCIVTLFSQFADHVIIV